MRIYCWLLLVTFSCQNINRQDESIAIPIEIGVDQTITEQIQYARIGLTKLSDYGFYVGKLSDLTPSSKVFPYDLNTPLFTDYAEKKRFIFLPEGKKIEYEEELALKFPVGSILIKNFLYTADQNQSAEKKILETRLLIHQENGWIALPYIWNQAQTEAYLEITGGKIPIQLKNKGRIGYTIPDMNQCKSCHDRAGKMVPIGPTVRQLNRIALNGTGNQLELLEKRGWLDLPGHDLPKLAIWNDERTGTLNERARAYLDINCAHCHNDFGPAKNSGLNLSIFETDDYRLGVNKKPVAAGRGSANLKYSIVPTHPDQSILVHRMQTTEPGTMMPELGRTVPHEEGLALIREWIKKM
ncbi:MAG: SO2930 family diheme c-type cytochrome [Reichenbachiella sp.]|uniref:SO2930 family diheme c-type cytochrome n=1 Tax=Reichenbachiella sp. TaxID=2184521 RepID=UPI0032677362